MLLKIKYLLNTLLNSIPIERILPDSNFKTTENGERIYFDASFQFHYNLNSDIGKSLYWSKKFEEFEISFFNRMIYKENYDIIMDIGANIGWNSFRWIRDSSIKKIFLFEPSRSTREILAINFKSVDPKRYEILPFAVSNENNTLKFFHCKDNAYSSLKDTQRKKVIETCDVQSVTLDSYFSSRKEVKFEKLLIKIDVEGFENDVIKGSINLITELKPDLFIEIFQGENSNPEPNFIFKFLLKYGYQIYAFTHERMLPVNHYNPKYYNYFFSVNVLS